MEWLIPLAAKSFLIAGGAFLLLKLLNYRSATDRSLIAHLALGGLLLLPVATVALPTLDVAGPEFLVGKAEVVSPSSVVLPATTPEIVTPSAPVADEPVVGSAAIDWPFWGYAAPAALLLLLTLIALARLFVLKARANVLVDAPWLTALARAQKRMGFKHGTALLTSNELPSPISWGVVRPVILLNAEAAESHDEAEAIITHELAHVANFDWAKLLLARIAVAIFWFNPLVWLLAREAHQLREEAADDAVLATDIEDTEYAKLLVGVARHECRGLLIGAHGVAPAKNSLARRVKRVLDGAVKRAPGGWRWGSAAAFFAAGMAVPVAALNLVPAAPATAADPMLAEAGNPYYAASSSSSATEIAANTAGTEATSIGGGTIAVDADGNTITTGRSGELVLRSAEGGIITVAPPDANGRRRTVLRSPGGNVIAYADARAVPGLAVALAHPHPGVDVDVDPDIDIDPPNVNVRGPNVRVKVNGLPGDRRGANSSIDRAIQMKAVGVTPEYVAAIRTVAPQLNLERDDIVALKAVGVTPAFIQELARLGYRNVDADDITGAYAVGVRADYVRSLASAGYGRLPLNKLTQLRAVGVTAADIERFRRAGYRNLDVDKLTELKALGITPEELKASEAYGP